MTVLVGYRPLQSHGAQEPAPGGAATISARLGSSEAKTLVNR